MWTEIYHAAKITTHLDAMTPPVVLSAEAAQEILHHSEANALILIHANVVRHVKHKINNSVWRNNHVSSF